MYKEILCTLIAAALGLCSGQNPKDGNVCLETPKLGQGFNIVKGWSYDPDLDKCYVFDHVRRSDYGVENIFLSESSCNQRCRPPVPAKCYAKPPSSKGTLDLPVSTYDPSTGTCLDIRAPVGDQGENVFSSNASCTRECRGVDLRLCLNATEADCDYIDGWGYGYDSEDQTCKEAADGFCGGFRSGEDCLKRCGPLVDNKCRLPIQDMLTCDEPQK
uniref:BPTI/Kunitz inhibitor domain-containing protein n=1 Tax=Ixodes ricinus TaxID=34613 RepID=V5HE62_IXORI